MYKYLQPRCYIRRIKRYWIGLNLRYNKNFVCAARVMGKQIRFYIDTWAEYDMRLKGSYTGEPTTLYWIDEIVATEDVVYDVGANVGAYALLLGRKIKDVGGEGVIYAIEPEASNFYKLNRNVQLNDLSPYVFPICLAFGPRIALECFHLQSLQMGAACHSLQKPFSEGQSFTSCHQQGVLAFTLNDFVKQKGVQFPNHIKIDVDGLEELVIGEGLDVLKDFRVKSLLIEINDRCSQGRVEALIEGCGFEELHRDQWKGPETAIHNLIYIRRS